MFTTQKMFLLDLLILEKHKESISKAIVEAGIFEPSPQSAYAREGIAWNTGNASESKKMIANFERYAGELKNFFQPYAENYKEKKAAPNLEAMGIPAMGDLLRQYQSKASSYNDSFSTLKRKKESLAVQMAGMRMYENADEDVKRYFYQSDKIYSVLGTIHSSNLPLLRHEIDPMGGIILSEGHLDDLEIVFLTVPRKSLKDLNTLLERMYFASYGLPAEMFGKGAFSIMQLGLEFTLACDEEEILQKACRQEAGLILDNLDLIDCSIQLYNKVSDIVSTTRQSGRFVLVSGWVCASAVKKFRREVEKICGSRYEMKVSDSDYFSVDTEIPTQLSNPPAFKPFETLVTLFGVPHYKELDPTPLVAVLYTIMYGAMFGDVGQGGVLFLVGLLGLLFKKSPLRLVFSLMVWVGLSAAFFGLLYGSIFGYEDVFHHWWISPMKQTNQLLLYSVLFGVGVILLGFILGFINMVRMKNWQGLIFSHKGIVALSIYIQALFIAYLVSSGKSPAQGLFYALGGSLLFLGLERVWEAFFYGHGQYSDAWMGIFDLFEFALSLISNTISFVRVGAFALTHGALMLTIFSLQDLAGSQAASLMILIGGNIFVIFFEGFIVGIQALRLEYYEFFIRFFQGSGRFFKPIKIDLPPQ